MYVCDLHHPYYITFLDALASLELCLVGQRNCIHLVFVMPQLYHMMIIYVDPHFWASFEGQISGASGAPLRAK